KNKSEAGQLKRERNDERLLFANLADKANRENIGDVGLGESILDESRLFDKQLSARVIFLVGWRNIETLRHMFFLSIRTGYQAAAVGLGGIFRFPFECPAFATI